MKHSKQNIIYGEMFQEVLIRINLRGVIKTKSKIYDASFSAKKNLTALTIFAKISIADARLGSKYTFESNNNSRFYSYWLLGSL